MTNWEWATSDKNRLAELLDVDGDFWCNVVSPWWCERACPNRRNGECIYDNCTDEYTSVQMTRMWLDAEHED